MSDAVLHVASTREADTVPTVAVKPGWDGRSFMAEWREVIWVRSATYLERAGRPADAIAACTNALERASLAPPRRFDLDKRWRRLAAALDRKAAAQPDTEDTQASSPPRAGVTVGDAYVAKVCDTRVAVVVVEASRAPATPRRARSGRGGAHAGGDVSDASDDGASQQGTEMDSDDEQGARREAVTGMLGDGSGKPPCGRKRVRVPTGVGGDTAVVTVERAMMHVFESHVEPVTLFARAPLRKARHATTAVNLRNSAVGLCVRVGRRVSPAPPREGCTGWRSLHGENLVWRTLFALLLWDEIHTTRGAAADAWRHPWHAEPLDMWSDGVFWARRSAALKRRLDALEAMTYDELHALVLAEHRVRVW